LAQSIQEFPGIPGLLTKVTNGIALTEIREPLEDQLRIE